MVHSYSTPSDMIRPGCRFRCGTETIGRKRTIRRFPSGITPCLDPASPSERIVPYPVQYGIKNLLEAVVGERLVGFGHLVNGFLLLDRPAPVVRRVQQFRRQLLVHGFFGTFPRMGDQPADPEGDPA